MGEFSDYYKILEISPESSYSQIKSSYRKLAKQYHPDRNRSSTANDVIVKINTAYEILSDAEKRKKYDEEYKKERLREVNHDALKPDITDNFSKINFNKYTNNDTSNEFSQFRIGSNGSNNGSNIHTNYHDNGESAILRHNYSSEKLSRYKISIDSSLCLAFGSCEVLAPRIFYLDKNKMINPKAKVISEDDEEFDAILAAAQTCPTKAIYIVDSFTDDQVFP